MNGIKIAIIGYGRMGHEVEAMALEKGHSVIAIIDNELQWDQQHDKLRQADVAIEFSRAESALKNYEKCFNMKLPVVSGTTGLSEIKAVEQLCNRLDGTFFYASNFSLGVNIFFEINRKLAQLFSAHKEYYPSITEIHHTGKLDSPSGTAISIANDIILVNPDFTAWQLTNEDKRQEKQIPVKAIRLNEVPGTHQVSYKGPIDEIEIKHTAFNRKGFALGAIMAAQWVIGKKGIFTMKDLLKF